ncbi:MAG: septum formation initiator family protein [Akkermansia sp.]
MPDQRRRYIYYDSSEPESPENARERGVNSLIRVFAIILLSLFFFVGGSIVLTPLIQLHALRQQQQVAEQTLERVKEEEAEAINRYLWIQDPEYYEQIARDRANMAKPGEVVVRPPAPSAPAATPRPRQGRD